MRNFEAGDQSIDGFLLTCAKHSRPNMTQIDPIPFAALAQPLAVERVRVFTAFEDARPAWMKLTASGAPSPYQDIEVLQAWTETIGAVEGVTPFLIVAEGAGGEPLALFPLGVKRRRPLRIAGFLGGKHVNVNLALFCLPEAWGRSEILDVLRRAATGEVDLLSLHNMPRSWRGVANPLARLDVHPAPSPNLSMALTPDFDHWFNSRLSKDSRKKWRKKRQGLEQLGAGSVEVADDAATAE